MTLAGLFSEVGYLIYESQRLAGIIEDKAPLALIYGGKLQLHDYAYGSYFVHLCCGDCNKSAVVVAWTSR
eukprot:3591980-Amphidinium_carterae.1